MKLSKCLFLVIHTLKRNYCFTVRHLKINAFRCCFNLYIYKFFKLFPVQLLNVLLKWDIIYFSSRCFRFIISRQLQCFIYNPISSILRHLFLHLSKGNLCELPFFSRQILRMIENIKCERNSCLLGKNENFLWCI